MEVITSCFPCYLSKTLNPCEEPPSYVWDRPIPGAYDESRSFRFVQTLKDAEKAGKELRENLDSIVRPEEISDLHAQQIVTGIEQIIKRGAPMGEALSRAVGDATDMAWEFAKEKAYYSMLVSKGTIVALGVLAVLAPWVLDRLGFGIRGPKAGKLGP